MTEDDIHDLFREMREEPVPAESLRRVRMAVADRTKPRVRTLWWSAAAVAAAAACLVVLILSRLQTVPVKQPNAPAEAARYVTVLPLPLPQDQVAKPRAATHRPRTTKRSPPASTQFVIRIETPDPDVLILLIGD